ncbi:MAG: TA system VapC family ribonuclease toxin [Gammaproteobacteria bacterium]
MRALLDVNVLIALFDADHVSHHATLQWFGNHANDGWASCPITQNGCLRIMSHPAYPNSYPVHAISERLHGATSASVHEFWPDSVSILNEQLIDTTRVHGARPLTDVYLLALAVHRGGYLVTFDRSIAMDAVLGATASHLLVL